MERSKRFALFVREMEEAAPAASFEEARQLLEAKLNEVEDAHSGVRFCPGNWRDDGRMYPPQDDSERKSPTAEVRVFRTRGHRVWIAANGAIRITTAGTPHDRIVLDKAGKDGGFCPAA
ncbi:MAG: hypothetical protein QOG13_68 [Sphingomonadales bacterium]|jgi:hypothetical protein|nr:hypothetical protein [Sphingomonadales bacterium]